MYVMIDRSKYSTRLDFPKCILKSCKRTSKATVSSDGLTNTTVSRTSLLWWRVRCPTGARTSNNMRREDVFCQYGSCTCFKKGSFQILLDISNIGTGQQLKRLLRILAESEQSAPKTSYWRASRVCENLFQSGRFSTLYCVVPVCGADT